jgi:hypothetical protein
LFAVDLAEEALRAGIELGRVRLEAGDGTGVQVVAEVGRLVLEVRHESVEGLARRKALEGTRLVVESAATPSPVR